MLHCALNRCGGPALSEPCNPNKPNRRDVEADAASPSPAADDGPSPATPLATVPPVPCDNGNSSTAATASSWQGRFEAALSARAATTTLRPIGPIRPWGTIRLCARKGMEWRIDSRGGLALCRPAPLLLTYLEPAAPSAALIHE